MLFQGEQRKPPGGSKETPDADLPETDLDAADPSDNMEPFETGRVIRYLKTLSAWSIAPNAVLAAVTASKALEVYHIELDPQLHINSQYIHAFVERYLKQIWPSTTSHVQVLAFFCSAKFIPLDKSIPLDSESVNVQPLNPKTTSDLVGGASIHVEASLMAVANCVRVGGGSLPPEQQKTLETVFMFPKMPIGVSKKCCFCCSLLARLLEKHLSNDQENQSSLQFILPGTHATIFPWIPPPIGLPVDVLIKMRSELFTMSCPHT